MTATKTRRGKHLIGKGRAGQLSPERKELIRQCMEDGWPKYEVLRTYGVNLVTIDKHFPEYPVFSQQERSEISVRVRNLNKYMRKRGLKVTA